MNLEIEGLDGLSGNELDLDGLSGNELDLDGLSGPMIANAALNKLDRLIKKEGVGYKARRLISQIRNALALNRTYVQYWKAKHDVATSPSDISKMLVEATQKQIVGLRAAGATE